MCNCPMLNKTWCNYTNVYHIVWYVGGGKHWWIPLKTTLAKILAIASLANNNNQETELAKNVGEYRYICDV